MFKFLILLLLVMCKWAGSSYMTAFRRPIQKQHDDNLHRKKNSSDGGSGGQWLIVLVLGAVLEDTRERHVVEVALLVDGRLPEELIHFLVREPVAHGGQQLTELFLLDHSCRRHKRHTWYTRSCIVTAVYYSVNCTSFLKFWQLFTFLFFIPALYTGKNIFYFWTSDLYLNKWSG